MSDSKFDDSGTDIDAASRPWAEVVERDDRAARQRVVPLPLALAALLLPLLAAWATAGEAMERRPGENATGGPRLSKALPQPLGALSRGTRLPPTGTGYVDLWGPLAPWEEAHLERRAGTAGR